MTKQISTTTLPGFLTQRGIGFDDMFNGMDTFLENAGGYPPYNLIKTGDDAYKIELAVAGFQREDLEITQNGKTLKVEGNKPLIEGETPEYLHKGISARSFKREFALAEYVTVTNAEMRDGILVIDLVREVPDAEKPRTIAIGK